jgi:MFS family permease
MTTTTTTATSIDSAAKAYVRHRFVRAFSASYMVLIVAACALGLLIGIVRAVTEGGALGVVMLPLGIALALLMVVPGIFALGAIGALFDAMHRRITGAVLIAVGAYVLFASFALVFTGVADGGEDGPWFVIAGILGLPIGYETLRHAWWQVAATREDFLAVRGWRASPWQVFSTFRRQLGLPAFLSYVGKKRMRATLLYFAVALMNVGLIMVLMLPIMFGSFTAQDDPLMVAGVLTVTIGLLAANVFGAGNIVARYADAGATALYQSVREWDPRAPITFLRSFNQDDDRVQVTGGDRFARMPAGISRSRTLDELLLEHGSPYGPVIAIGDPRDPVPPLGAARVFVPERGNGWQEVVRGLVDASKCVVMCPNTGRGVQWELDLIASSTERLNLIFLASPELTRADTLALFQRLVADLPEIAADQTPIAAYAERGREWRVLTAKTLTLNAYTAALNASLQALFGLEGVALAQNKKPQPEAGALNVEAAKAA